MGVMPAGGAAAVPEDDQDERGFGIFTGGKTSM